MTGNDDQLRRELFQPDTIYAVDFFVTTTSEAVANQLLDGKGFSVHVGLDERWCGIGKMPWLIKFTTTGVPLPGDQTPKKAWALIQKAIDSIPRGTGLASTMGQSPSSRNGISMRWLRWQGMTIKMAVYMACPPHHDRVGEALATLAIDNQS